MGDVASTIRKQAKASTKAAQTKTTAGVQLLEEMGRRLIEQFHAKVRLEKQDPFEFELGKIIMERSEIRLLTSEDNGKLKNSVRNFVEDIAIGDVADAICGVVEKGIDALLGSAVGSVSEKKFYTVMLDAISVLRIDIYLYEYDITASGLITTHSHLFVFAYTISTIQNVTPKLLQSVISLSLPPTRFPDERIKAAFHLYNKLAPIMVKDEKHPEEKVSEE